MFAKKFPLQQGDLDSLCSIYAVINLLHSRGEIADFDAAVGKFQKLIDCITAHPEGNVAGAVKAGVYRGDVPWFLEQLGRKVAKKNAPNVEDIVEGVKKGAIIFFKVLQGNFDHYTVLSPASTAARLELIDSYGFDEILASDGGWTLKGEPVEIKNLYVLAG